jgi:chloramphenicol-sensitive protein RarD
MGLLLYIAPTLQFMLGTLVYHEPFTYPQLIGYCIIWTALIIFVVEGLLSQRVPDLKGCT